LRRDIFNFGAGRLAVLLLIFLLNFRFGMSSSQVARKLGCRESPRKLATVRDRYGNGSAPACEGDDRRLYCCNHR
jgi:hypothetical protein